MKEKIYCGLDIGSSKISAVIGGVSEEDRKVNILGVGEAQNSGLKHGVVVNIDNTTRAICRAVENAEHDSEVKVKDVIVNVNGHYIEGHMHQGATKIPRSDREITPEDIDRVINSARAVPLSSDKQIIHAIPLDFKVDNQNGVEDPVGMEGNHLEVDVLLITGDRAPINNLDKCIIRAGLGVNRIVSTILAPAQTVVADEEKELGCVLVDIGAQTINMAIFVEGKISFIGEIDIGADFITYDLAHGLRTSFSEAKRIKETYGCAVNEESLDMEIEYVGVDGQSENVTTIEKVNKIIEPRVEDIVEFIGEEISKSGHKQMVPGGIILSGGGAQLKGIEHAIKKNLINYEVRVGRPRNLKGKVDKVNAPRFSTCVGLIEYIVKTDGITGLRNNATAGKEGFWEKLKVWFDEIF
ncbi:MAG: cell division protein FtsA [Elusimicrobiota bacterium]